MIWAKEAFKLTTEDDDSGYSVGNIVTLGDDGFIKPIGFRKGIPIEAKQFYIDENSWCTIDDTPVSDPGAGNYSDSVSGHFTLPQNYNFLTKKFRLLLIIGSNDPRDLNAHIVASDIINLEWYGSTIAGYKIGFMGTCKVSFPIGADLNAYSASNDTFGLIAYLYFDEVFTSTYNTPLFIQLYTQRTVSSQSTVKEYYLNEEQAKLIKGLVIEYIN